MAHKSWWVREFQLLPPHNPLLTLSKSFFLTIRFLFQISASCVGPRIHFWSSSDPCQQCCSSPTVNTRSSPDNLNDTWWVRKYFNFFLPITHYWRSVNFTVILTIPFWFRFQQVASILELIDDVVGSLVSLVVILLRLVRICRRIWSSWTARQPVVVAHDHQNEVPLADINHGQNNIPLTDVEGDAANGQNDVIVNEELNIWTHRFRENISCTCNSVIPLSPYFWFFFWLKNTWSFFSDFTVIKVSFYVRFCLSYY